MHYIRSTLYSSVECGQYIATIFQYLFDLFGEQLHTLIFYGGNAIQNRVLMSQPGNNMK
jgi:hypothetical protein